jgi:hypothetical protein
VNLLEQLKYFHEQVVPASIKAPMSCQSEKMFKEMAEQLEKIFNESKT